MSSYDYALLKVDRNGILALKEIEDHFSVYPNPFSSAITISFDLFEPKNISVILKSIDGKMISNLFNEKLNESTSYNYTFHLGNLIEKGMYILEMYYDDKRVIKKIIKC